MFLWRNKKNQPRIRVKTPIDLELLKFVHAKNFTSKNCCDETRAFIIIYLNHVTQEGFYYIYLAVRWGGYSFQNYPEHVNQSYAIYRMGFTLPEQSQKSKSVLYGAF